MNAKKSIKFVVLATAGLAMLVGCNSEKTLTRTEAVTVLDAISAKTTASDFKAPTKGKITASGYVTNFDTESQVISTVYSAEASVTVSSSKTTIAAKTEIYAWKDGSNYSIYENDGTNKYLYTDSTGLLKALLDSVFENKVALASYNSAFAKYLNNFDDSGALTGATVKAGAVMKTQSYKSSGDGNLKVDNVVNYGYDETLKYEWKDNLCVVSKGATQDWGNCSFSKPSTDGATSPLGGILWAGIVAAAL
jgi:hypothetical protein